MKKLLLAFQLLSVSAFAQTNRLVTVEWSAVGDQSTVYRLKHAPELNQPFATIAQTQNTNATVNVIEGVNFFTVTASNFWGETPPSEMAVTPPKPTPPSLRIYLTP